MIQDYSNYLHNIAGKTSCDRLIVFLVQHGNLIMITSSRSLLHHLIGMPLPSLFVPEPLLLRAYPQAHQSERNPPPYGHRLSCSPSWHGISQQDMLISVTAISSALPHNIIPEMVLRPAIPRETEQTTHTLSEKHTVVLYYSIELLFR